MAHKLDFWKYWMICWRLITKLVTMIDNDGISGLVFCLWHCRSHGLALFLLSSCLNIKTQYFKIGNEALKSKCCVQRSALGLQLCCHQHPFGYQQRFYDFIPCVCGWFSTLLRSWVGLLGELSSDDSSTEVSVFQNYLCVLEKMCKKTLVWYWWFTAEAKNVKPSQVQTVFRAWNITYPRKSSLKSNYTGVVSVVGWS